MGSCLCRQVQWPNLAHTQTRQLCSLAGLGLAEATLQSSYQVSPQMWHLHVPANPVACPVSVIAKNQIGRYGTQED